MNTQNLYDLIVVGGGPAGLTAAIYMARARYKTLVLEKDKIGGQISITSEVVNYPGIFNTSGAQLTQKMAKQAESFGAEIKFDEVLELKLNQDIKEIVTKETTYRALTVIIATGANPRKLGFEGEAKYQGRGVAYCATCDGEFFTGKDIFVIGGGFAACEEAMFLTRYGKSVTMIVREAEMTCAQSIADEVKNHEPKINIHFNSEIVSLEGDDLPRKATFINNITKETWSYENPNDTFGTFVFAGYVPNTGLVKDQVELDRGYLVTDDKLQTSLKGVFGAGDLRIKDLRQVVTATSDGALAATSAEKEALRLHKELNIPSLFDAKVHKLEEETQESHTETSSDSSKFIDEAMVPQLKSVFDQLLEPVEVQMHVNKTSLGFELRNLAQELNGISDQLSSKIIEDVSDSDTAFITLNNNDNYCFKGIPGGHEFTSFILTIYRLYGPKKDIDEESLKK